jgi:hypothetical protein
MTMRSLLVLCGILALSSDGYAMEVPKPAHEPSQDEAQRILSAVAPHGTFSLGSMSNLGYTLQLKEDGRRQGDLVVGFEEPGRDRPRVRSEHYTVEIFNVTGGPGTLQSLAHAATATVAMDGGALPELPDQLLATPLTPLAITAFVMFVLALAAGRVRRWRTTWDLRKPHIIQGCVHTSIFVYWSFYWPGVHYQAPVIVMMLALAYACDAFFAFLRFGSWRVGLSPVPVVLSTNLFVWLDWKGAAIAMIGAFASKTFLQRDGRHIINPSVAGLTINALCTILLPGVVHFGGLFHTLNIAPNMAEWIFLGSLIPLTVFRLLPVSIGSIIGLHYLTNAPGALRPTLLLMMTLLSTDPATTPRSNLGRVLFGLLVGSTYIVYRHLLMALGQPDDFAKILSVPLANILVPWFDVAATRVSDFARPRWAAGWRWTAARIGGLAVPLARLGRRLIPIPNIAFVATWVVLFVVALGHEKRLDFEPALHWTWGTPLVVRDTGDVPTCAGNPIFCTRFSFVSEAQAWAAGRGSAPAAPLLSRAGAAVP